MTRHTVMTVYLPVAYAEAADRIAALASAGLIPIQPHWLDEQSCRAWIANLTGGTLRDRYRPTRAVIEITEGAGAEGMDRCARDALVVGHRALGENHQGARHVA